MADGAHRIVVGRLRKPHGLKGEVTLFPLTDRPDEVFTPGRRLAVVDLAGDVAAGPFAVERARAYHREWIVKFREVEVREAWDPWRGLFLAADAAELPVPEGDEVWLHELAGFAVQRADGTPLGIVTDAYELPGGITIEVQGPKREFLLPYRREFVLEVDRAARRLVVAPPEGLLDE
jgi:16S rRNA processing protein RimM